MVLDTRVSYPRRARVGARTGDREGRARPEVFSEGCRRPSGRPRQVPGRRSRPRASRGSPGSTASPRGDRARVSPRSASPAPSARRPRARARGGVPGEPEGASGIHPRGRSLVSNRTRARHGRAEPARGAAPGDATVKGGATALAEVRLPEFRPRPCRARGAEPRGKPNVGTITTTPLGRLSPLPRRDARPAFLPLDRTTSRLFQSDTDLPPQLSLGQDPRPPAR